MMTVILASIAYSIQMNAPGVAVQTIEALSSTRGLIGTSLPILVNNADQASSNLTVLTKGDSSLDDFFAKIDHKFEQKVESESSRNLSRNEVDSSADQEPNQAQEKSSARNGKACEPARIEKARAHLYSTGESIIACS